jgi:branched-chain amino acid transport system ATP-binding protein
MTVLRTEDLSVSYGGVHAVDAVSIQLEEGRAVGLIGPNRAGKTTFLDGMTALTPATGRVIFDERDISKLPAHQRARLGLRRTWQSVELFDDLTVGENLAVSHSKPTFGSVCLDFVRARPKASRAEVLDALRTFSLEDCIDEMPQSLALGVRKLVGVARSLVSKPRVIGFDEPAAGLDKYESREFGQRLRQVSDANIAVLLIDHDMDLVLSVCDDIYVLDFGRVIAHGTPAEIRANDDVLTAYLGRDVREDQREPASDDPASDPGKAEL